MRRSIALLFAALAAAPATAQSRGVPQDDRDDGTHSHLWDQALDPNRAPYDQLVAQARRMLPERPTAEQAQTAIDLATKAIALAADRPDAYMVRGQARFARMAWAECADDLGAAAERAANRPVDAPPDFAWSLPRARELGLCQARAGRYADAERTLAAMATAGVAQGELLMRLGEVRVALGKLDEAIETLHAAEDLADRATQATIEWLLAAAYDRARRPEDADASAARAAAIDRSFALIENPQLPLLGVGEKEYLLGLAYRSERGAGGAFREPEKALLYFRRFLAVAGADNPWRRRADEHVKELASLELPQAIDRVSGSAPLDLDSARVAVRHAMPQLRACLAKTPWTLFEVTVTRTGPRTPDTALDRPHYRMPPAGAAIKPVPSSISDADREHLDAAVRCLEPVVAKLALPTPKERDTHYLARFVVMAP
jgi:tetratricopeptide (TPR) repeat protein